MLPGLCMVALTVGLWGADEAGEPGAGADEAGEPGAGADEPVGPGRVCTSTLYLLIHCALKFSAHL